MEPVRLEQYWSSLPLYLRNYFVHEPVKQRSDCFYVLNSGAGHWSAQQVSSAVAAGCQDPCQCHILSPHLHVQPLQHLTAGEREEGVGQGGRAGVGGDQAMHA